MKLVPEDVLLTALYRSHSPGKSNKPYFMNGYVSSLSSSLSRSPLTARCFSSCTPTITPQRPPTRTKTPSKYCYILRNGTWTAPTPVQHHLGPGAHKSLQHYGERQQRVLQLVSIVFIRVFTMFSATAAQEHLLQVGRQSLCATNVRTASPAARYANLTVLQLLQPLSGHPQ